MRSVFFAVIFAIIYYCCCSSFCSSFCLIFINLINAPRTNPAYFSCISFFLFFIFFHWNQWFQYMRTTTAACVCVCVCQPKGKIHCDCMRKHTKKNWIALGLIVLSTLCSWCNVIRVFHYYNLNIRLTQFRLSVCQNR